jgi:regulator of sigma E protease
VGQTGDQAVDIGLILAATTQEPGLATWLGLKILAWFGVAAGLTFVIFVHELGHFLVAKACGVKCEKFYVGFDFFEFRIPFTKWKVPRSLIKFQWGETEYGLGSLPLGGYVKMLGQDDDPRNAEHEAARIRTAAATERTNEAVVTPHAIDPQHPEQAPVAAQTTEGKTILLDPRSYPAKPIPARMAIISAGVIMNLIFAVILAAVAFRLGVEEMPAIVGSTSPGGAAWVEGIEPGSKIIQIGRRGEPYAYLRWGDIRTTALLNSGHDVSFLVRKPNGQEHWYEVRPAKIRDSKQPLVGIGVPRKPEIDVFPKELAYLNAQTSPSLEDFDLITDAAGQKVTSGADLAAIFAQQPLGPLELKVERRERTPDGKPVEKPTKAPETIDVVVQPRPMRVLGIATKIGPIVAVQEGSPAERADLRVGDLIVEINGQPIGDPLSLSQRLTPTADDSGAVNLTVETKDRQGHPVRRTVSVNRNAPLQSPTQMPMNPTSIESIGAAFEVTPEVAEIDTNGPAANSGIVAGDAISEVQLVAEDEPQATALKRLLGKRVFEPMKLEPGEKSWAEVNYVLQMIFPDTKVKLTWTHGDKVASATLAPRASTTFFNDTRGITLYVDFESHRARNWKEAAALGFREARDQLTQVLTILQRFASLRLSPTNLSGPIGIIDVAGKFASQGVAPLLLFLTMLSANLAVLNFLPIPALDGGHMLFLSAEAIRGKPVDEKLQIRLTVAGVICLLSLMIFATAMDIHRWFG